LFTPSMRTRIVAGVRLTAPNGSGVIDLRRCWCEQASRTITTRESRNGSEVLEWRFCRRRLWRSRRRLRARSVSSPSGSHAQNAGVRHCCGVMGDTLNLIARSNAASGCRSDMKKRARSLRSASDRSLDRRCRKLRSRQSALHQRNLRGESKSCARGPDRKPRVPLGVGV